MDSGLEGACVLVTGASGGIGFALAEAFAAEGARLALHAGKNRARLEEKVAAQPWKERARCFNADIRSPEKVDRLFAEAEADFGPVDVCIANAGLWPKEELRLDELAADRVRETIETNLLGSMWTARSFMRSVARREPRADGAGASICLIGSTAGHFGERGHSDYAAAKAGLRGLAMSLKNEIVAIDPWARVNVVEPGWTITPMTHAKLDDASNLQRVLSTMPLRQLGRAEDVARAVVFLSSPRLARHLSGEIVTVAGGMEGRQLHAPEDVDVDLARARTTAED